MNATDIIAELPTEWGLAIRLRLRCLSAEPKLP